MTALVQESFRAITSHVMEEIASNEDEIGIAILHGINNNGDIIKFYYSRVICPNCSILFNTIHQCYSCNLTYYVSGLRNVNYTNPSPNPSPNPEITYVKYNNSELIAVVPCYTNVEMNTGGYNYAYCFNYGDSYYVIQNNNIFYADEAAAIWLLGQACFYRTCISTINNSGQIPVWYKSINSTKKAYLIQTGAEDWVVKYYNYADDDAEAADDKLMTAVIHKSYAEYSVHLHHVSQNALVIVPKKQSSVMVSFNDIIKAYILEYIQEYDFIISSAQNIQFKYIILPDLSVSYVITVKILYKISDKIIKIKQIVMYSKNHQFTMIEVRLLAYNAIYSAVHDPTLSASKCVYNLISTLMIINNANNYVEINEIDCDFKVINNKSVDANVSISLSIVSTNGFGRFGITRTCSENYEIDFMKINVLSAEMVAILKKITIAAATAATMEIIADRTGTLNAFLNIKSTNSVAALKSATACLFANSSANNECPIKLTSISVVGKIITIIVERNSQSMILRSTLSKVNIPSIQKTTELMLKTILRSQN